MVDSSRTTDGDSGMNQTWGTGVRQPGEVRAGKSCAGRGNRVQSPSGPAAVRKERAFGSKMLQPLNRCTCQRHVPFDAKGRSEVFGKAKSRDDSQAGIPACPVPAKSRRTIPSQSMKA